MARASLAPVPRSTPRTFDVICAGAALWDVDPNGAPDAPALRPGRGAVGAALSLASKQLHVGLATVLADDTVGRDLRDRIANANVAVDGVTLSFPKSGIFFVQGGARQTVALQDEDDPVTVPENWSARLLLLSGMSPVVAHGAALCRAARAARRSGTVVMVDLNARWELWKDRDARAINMLLREADVVWCTSEDLLGLKMDVDAIVAAMRPGAVFATCDVFGKAWAVGPFGKVSSTEGSRASADAFVSAICAELARNDRARPESGDVWDRALRAAR
jgi:sugar/nucleoside kinase (ribokinase family)